MKANKKVLSLAAYLLLLSLSAGSNLAIPKEIKASESWNLFTTLPPVSSESQKTVLGAQDLYTGTSILPIQGDMVLAHVNKHQALPASYVPPGLTKITAVATSGVQYLRSGVLPYLYQLFGAAGNAGHKLSVISSYRSYQTQIATFNYWVNLYGFDVASQGSALPGNSEHQLGTTLDLGLAGKEWPTGYSGSAAASWVARNAPKFGFTVSYQKGKESLTGYIAEDWHIRWIGINLATQLYKKGLILEEYLSQ